MTRQILSNSCSYLHICLKLIYNKIIGSLLFRGLVLWLKIFLAHFLLCCTNAWRTLMRWQNNTDLVYRLSNSFGYFRFRFMKYWQEASGLWMAVWPGRERGLTVWQRTCGTPDIGQVVVFNGWHNCCMVVCDDCRSNRVGALIDQAKVCLDVVLLSVAKAKYLDRVAAAHCRGVSVRVLASDEMLAANGQAMQLLCALEVPMRSYSIGVIFGYNFAIIDDEKRVLEIEAKRDTVPTSPWRPRGNLKGCLNWVLPAVWQKKDNRNDNYHYQKFFDEWNSLYPITLPYFTANNFTQRNKALHKVLQIKS